MAYWLSKILPLALLPLGHILNLLPVGLIGRWRWPVITVVLLLCMFPLVLASLALWCWLENPWRRQSAAKPASADVIVVLSGGRHPAPGFAKVNEWLDSNRSFAGLELYRHGKAQRLLFAGGSSP